LQAGIEPNQAVNSRQGCQETHTTCEKKEVWVGLKPIFDSQRRFLLGRCSPGAASRAIQVPGPQKCSAISLPKFFSMLL
jgi:hypothetical protein